MINELPTIFEVVTGVAKKQVKEKSSVPNHSNKSKSNSNSNSKSVDYYLLLHLDCCYFLVLFCANVASFFFVLISSFHRFCASSSFHIDDGSY